MITTTVTVNETVKLYFQATSGIVAFTSLGVLNNGLTIANPSISAIETSSAGIYSITYTPLVTGRSVIIHSGVIVAYLEVVARNVYSFLKNIEDESLGSWTWNKQLGKLSMLKQDGTSLANFDVIDSGTTASRERTS